MYIVFYSTSDVFKEEKKYLSNKNDNFMAFYYRYANSPLIDEL